MIALYVAFQVWMMFEHQKDGKYLAKIYKTGEVT
jgi:hypothetical protein